MITKQQLRKAWDNLLVEEVKEHGGIPYLTKTEKDFRELLAGYLLQGKMDLQRAAKEEGEIQATEGEVLICFLFGMEFAMRIVRNTRETFFNGKKPDETMLEGICAMIRLVQVEVGSGRQELPEFTEEEVQEIRRIS